MSDKLFISKKTQKYSGVADCAVRYLERDALCDSALWKKFVNQFREQIDGTNNGWRGEYWGKMMRGASWVYEYSQSAELYDALCDTVNDLISAQEPDGRVSSFSRDTEFRAWDIWCRKYVLLGMQYFLEICKDNSLSERIVEFMCRHADYIIEHIGNGEGQIPINEASSAWYGVNSSSILEPIVRLYSLTKKQSYFDFATYIINEGGSLNLNIFDMALENTLYPYQYGVSKAYEMISCFEGIIEYYRITGIEKYKEMAINFGRAVMDSEISVIGSCGCTHELFDHTLTRQTAEYEGVMQETCVTVTWMKYCAQLLRLTGDSAFADCMEHSFYNAYLGALNTEHQYSEFLHRDAMFAGKHIVDTFLPFDSYSPLTPGIRGHKAVGGVQIFSDGTYYGCCACIGAAGVGVFLKHAILSDENGVVINFFEQGEADIDYKGTSVNVKIETAYPAASEVKLTLTPSAPVDMTLKVRIPDWSAYTQLDCERDCNMNAGYAVFDGRWEKSESITLIFDMSVRIKRPISWESDTVYTDMDHMDPRWYAADKMNVTHNDDDDKYISLSYGPITLAADSRCSGDVNADFDLVHDDATLRYEVSDNNQITDGVPCTVRIEFQDTNGNNVSLVDYASAGRDWKSTIAAWLPYGK